MPHGGGEFVKNLFFIRDCGFDGIGIRKVGHFGWIAKCGDSFHGEIGACFPNEVGTPLGGALSILRILQAVQNPP
jgi:hypothetical protein